METSGSVFAAAAAAVAVAVAVAVASCDLATARSSIV